MSQLRELAVLRAPSGVIRLVCLALLVFVPMAIEARRAARNERQQRARGGLEPEGDVYQLMQWAYPGVFAAMLIEDASVGGHASVAWWRLGVGIFAVAKILKWWAILTLGPCWTFRVIVVPGTAPVRRGPYRFLRHPNYIGVLGELAGVALMSTARVAGPLGIVLFASLMMRRVWVENRALDAILRRS